MQQNFQMNSADRSTLYVVATPIGNLGDISLRAKKYLEGCNAVICEDSRVTSKLLAYLGIKKSLIIYNDNSSQKDREKILHRLNSGQSLSLVSDAGTPLICDPGFKLINFLRENDCKILSIPGPSSPIAALAISGLPSDRFTFGGFIPNSPGARQKFLNEFATLNHTLIFFERATRLATTLRAAQEIFGDKKAVICRELTKLYEEIISGKISELLEKKFKGEVVLLIDNREEKKEIDDDEIAAAIKNNQENLSPNLLAKKLAAEFGLSKKEIYSKILKINATKETSEKPTE